MIRPVPSTASSANWAATARKRYPEPRSSGVTLCWRRLVSRALLRAASTIVSMSGPTPRRVSAQQT